MPQQYRLILKNMDAPGYTPDLGCYLRHGGYEALKKALAWPAKTLPDGKKVPPRSRFGRRSRPPGCADGAGRGSPAG